MHMAAALHVRHELGSATSPFHCKHAALQQIRYSQGTTEELRFFSLLLSLWALKHSTKRRLHWVRSWWETRQTREDQKNRSWEDHGLQQASCINSKRVMAQDEVPVCASNWFLSSVEELDETLMTTWLYSSEHQRRSPTHLPGTGKVTERVANKLLVRGPSRFQLPVQTADVDSWPKGTCQTPRGFTHPELLFQLCAACGTGREDAVDITVQLWGGHLCLSAQDVLHQSIVDENILLLRGDVKCSKSYIYIRNGITPSMRQRQLCDWM